MAIEVGQDFLEEYGISGLSSIIAAAIVKVGHDSRARKVLFSRTIQKVCQIAVEAGLDPTDLCEAAMDILEFSHQESIRLRKELEEKRRAEAQIEVDKMQMEISNEGL